MSDAYPGGVNDGRDTPPELSSDGELHIGLDDVGISEDLQNDDSPIGEAEAAFMYDLADVLHKHARDGDVAPAHAFGMLSAFTDTVQEDVGIADAEVLAKRFGIDEDAATFLQRPTSAVSRLRLALARRVAP